MEKFTFKHGWWILFILGTIGLCFTNYYVIMIARILWLVGLSILFVRIFDWINTWKIWQK